MRRPLDLLTMFDFGDQDTSLPPNMDGKDTPPDLEVSSAIRFVQSDLQTMSDGEELSLEIPMTRPAAGPSKQLERKNPVKPNNRHPESDVSTASSETDGEMNVSKMFYEEYNPKDYDNLDVPPEIKELFEYIVRYTPQKLDIEYKLQPFIPDYIPAVGDIDAFLKVLPPNISESDSAEEMNRHLASLGLKVLDEPCGNQTDPALLHMKLRSVSTVTGALISGPPPGIAKSGKDIERWISEMQTIHANRSHQQTVLSSNSIPTVGDIDMLMSEWPPEVEQALDVIGFPSPELDCSLMEYIEIVCTILDVPIGKEKTQADYINALNTLFNLYSAIRNI